MDVPAGAGAATPRRAILAARADPSPLREGTLGARIEPTPRGSRPRSSAELVVNTAPELLAEHERALVV